MNNSWKQAPTVVVSTWKCQLSAILSKVRHSEGGRDIWEDNNRLNDTVQMAVQIDHWIPFLSSRKKVL